jgi:hypothetical protein
MRLILLLATALLITSACTLAHEKGTVAGAYSGSFAYWFYNSLPLPQEIAQLQEEQRVLSETTLRSRMQDIATRQVWLNGGMQQATPPEQWRPFHEEILAAMASFEAATEDIRLRTSDRPVPELLTRLESEQRELRQRVIDCYVQSPTCR